MLNQGKQRVAPAAQRRLAEAIARKLLAQRAQQTSVASGALAGNALPAQHAQQPLQMPRSMPAAPSPMPEALAFAPSPEALQAPAISHQLPAEAQRQTLELSPDDINILKKVLATEAVAGLPPEIYRQQAAGIVDTILNRRVHGKWGDSIEAVVNAPYQFSDINGPVAWKRNRRNVHQIPDDALKGGAGLLASQFVDGYLARRAAGEPSAIGGHLNYANPHYSDASNLSWIRKLDGPRLGQGQAVHWHGTAQGLTPVDPNYAIRIPGQRQFPSAFGVDPLPPMREAPQFDAPPALPQQLPPASQQQQMPNAAPMQQRAHIHPAILAALMKQQAAPPAGIDPQVWKHMTEEERALWQKI